MAGGNVPKFHSVDITLGQKLSSALEKRIIAYGNRVTSNRQDFVTICDEVINENTCKDCRLAEVCMSSMAERR